MNLLTFFHSVSSKISPVMECFPKILSLLCVAAGQFLTRCSGVSGSSLHSVHLSVVALPTFVRYLFRGAKPVIVSVIFLISFLFSSVRPFTLLDGQQSSPRKLLLCLSPIDSLHLSFILSFVHCLTC